MKDWKRVRIPPGATIREAIAAIDAGALQIALVVDEQERLIGTVTDGDIRRGILSGVGLQEEVGQVMNRTPTVAGTTLSREEVVELMTGRGLAQIPIVDADGRLVGLEVPDRLISPPVHDNWVVLMAGGLGARLKPMTENCPKPMLKVGGKPILETILESLIAGGFHRFYLAVNYMAQMIENHFGDGGRWGVEIRYLREKQPLGTAGALALLPDRPSEPLLVMNGDLLTKVSFPDLLRLHREQDARATACVREYDFQVPFGVVEVEGSRINGIEEKPVHRFFVNAGIYILEPAVLESIKPGDCCDMTVLIENLLASGEHVAAFPIREYWLDVGRQDDFERAEGDFDEVFS